MSATTAIAWDEINFDLDLSNVFDENILFDSLFQPPWLNKSIESIHKLLTLKPNWDSYGAKPINRASALYAIELLEKATVFNTAKPTIVPTSNGHIQIEWHINNVDLELEVFPNSRVHCYFDDLDNNEEPVESTLSYDWRNLEEYINRLSV